MGSGTKYIMIDNGLTFVPIIFPDVMKHDEIAARMHPYEVVSAGFISFGDDGTPTCYGKSISLGIGSDPIDSQLVRKFLTRH